jgi:hypothetical protein
MAEGLIGQIFQAARMSFLHSKLFLETVNLATALPRFVQHQPSGLVSPRPSFGKGIDLVALPQTATWFAGPKPFVAEKLLLRLYDGVVNVWAFRSAHGNARGCDRGIL